MKLSIGRLRTLVQEALKRPIPWDEVVSNFAEENNVSTEIVTRMIDDDLLVLKQTPEETASSYDPAIQRFIVVSDGLTFPEAYDKFVELDKLSPWQRR